MKRTTCVCAMALLMAFVAPVLAQVDVASHTTDAVKQMDALLATAYKADAPGAAVIVVKDGKPLLRKGYGMANLELGVPIRPYMVFRIGSMTKQFTTVAILMLVQQHKVALDDDVTKYLPSYPTQGQKITIENLLTHTSGIKNYTDIPSWLTMWRKDFTVPELVDLFKNEPMDFDPGQKWSYSNSGYILLGAIIEKASGQSYANFIRTRIFEPLGMKHSYYDSDIPIIPGRVSGYERSDKGFVNADYLSMTQPYAAGSLLSSVDDLALWDAALYTDKLVPQVLLKKAWTAYQLQDGYSTGYGYGWSIWTYQGHRTIEHNGGINGFASDGLRMPDDHVYVAVLSNCPGLEPGPDNLALKLAALAIGEPRHDPAVIKLDPSLYDRYVGTYQLSASLQLIVKREGAHLFLLMADRPDRELYPSSETEFFLHDAFSHFTFVRSAAGEATAMIVHQKGLDTKADKVK
jgi:D-alanyl-D-alanine carboxypeptidase